MSDENLLGDQGDKGAADKGTPADKSTDKGAAGASDKDTAVSADAQREFLVKAGGKADEIGKLSEADLKAKYAEAKTAADKAAKGGAPDKYEFKAPQGQELDGALVTEFSALAKADGLSQEKAQRYIDLAVKVTGGRDTLIIDAAKKQQKSWADAARADKELSGGEGFDVNLAVAKAGIKAFDTDGSLQKAIDMSGLGSHPDFIRAFYKIARATGNDKLVNGKQGDSKPADRGVFSYPNSQHKG